MADNPRNQKRALIRKNIHNFSWFPSILLLFQLFLLLFGLFKLDHEIVDAFAQFLQESSLFLSIINGLLILWCWIKDTILKQRNISKEFKIINSCICVTNIVLLNKFYDNNKINEVFGTVKAFFSGENITVYIFVLVIVVAIFLIARYGRKEAKVDLPDETKPTNPANYSTATGNDQPQRTSSSTTKASSSVKDRSVNILFFIIFMFLILLIVVAGYILVAKYNILSNIINDADKGSNILTYLLLVISVITIIILSFIIIVAIARSLSRFIYKIPKYIRETQPSYDRIIKIAVGIVLIPVFYGITKLFGIGTDWVLDLLQKQDFLVVPFIMLLYFVLSILFVEVVYSLISGNERTKWIKSFTEIISTTGDSVVSICGSIVKSFFRLLKFMPDFLESIQTVFMGEDDETVNTQNKPSDQNNQGDNNNQGKGDAQ